MKKFLVITAFLCPFITLSCQQRTSSQEISNNWQWRGYNRNGVYNETGLLKEWPTEGPQLLWKFEGLGEGHTSVAIANEKLYVSGMHEDNLVLYVFDLNGNLLTEKEIGKEWNNNWNGTRSSVCINEGKLYIFNALGNLYCLDETTLNMVWTKDVLNDFDGRNLMFGMTENPLIVGDKLFLTPGGLTNGMVALNKNSGELIWSSSGIGMPSSYCSPLYIGDYAIPIVVNWFASEEEKEKIYDNKIAAFNADTGELLWEHTLPSENDINPNMPIYSNGMMLIITGYKGGAWMFQIKEGGKAAELVWHNQEMDNQMGGAIKVGDYIYTSGHTNRNWFCVDWKTGETQYKAADIAPCNVIYADGMLYCYSEKGTMNLVKPNPEQFEKISTFNITLGTDQHWAHPVIHNGILYIRHGNALMAYNIKQ